jgi:hypothetical protein
MLNLKKKRKINTAKLNLIHVCIKSNRIKPQFFSIRVQIEIVKKA